MGLTAAPRLKVLSVGSNAVSAFLSWRLQASNACDVTIVWKQNHAHVAQYGLSFKSQVLDNVRFKPRRVVMSPDDAAAVRDTQYDYVFLSIKALPDVYDMAAVIESVVTPNHTCILVNTTHAVGLEATLEERFPSNIVLSLVCDADLSQIGPSEFEHRGSTRIWVGPASKHPTMEAIQTDMAHALVLTLNAGSQMDCVVSPNIRQQQFEHVAGPIAFHPLSVIFETPNHQALLEKPGVSELVDAILDEVVSLATALACKLPDNFKQTTIDEMARPAAGESLMWQDFAARRPMEVEAYLGSPIRLAKELNMSLPRLETLYPILRNTNSLNQQRPPRNDGPINGGSPISPHGNGPMPRLPTNGNGIPMSRPMGNGVLNGAPNGMGPNQRPRGQSNSGPSRRMPMNGPAPSAYRLPPMNGPPVNGYGSRQQSRRGSVEMADLEEFSQYLAYGEDATNASVYDMDQTDMVIRERPSQMGGWDQRRPNSQRRLIGPGMGPMGPRSPIMMNGQRGPGPQARRPPQPAPRPTTGIYDDEDDEDDGYVTFDPTGGSGPPLIDPDNFDMMSVTSRKNRRVPPPSNNQVQFRKKVGVDNSLMSRGGWFRPRMDRDRWSSQQQPNNNNNNNSGVHPDVLLDESVLGNSAGRYGPLDRGAIADSRANSLSSQRFEELPNGSGSYSVARRISQAPPLRMPVNSSGGKSSPVGPLALPSPNGYTSSGNGPSSSSSPSEQARQPRFPNGHLGAGEYTVGSNGNSPLPSTTISLTGSASASANSGDMQGSNSAQSAQSIQSHGSRLVGGVR